MDSEARGSPLHLQLLGAGISAGADSEISADKLKKIPYGTIRPQTCTPAPLAACLVCSNRVIQWWERGSASLSCSVNTKITHLQERLESSRSPSIFQPLTIIQVDILHHAEHFLNAKYCSYYVTVMKPAQVPWHLNGRVSEKVVEGDIVRD